MGGCGSIADDAASDSAPNIAAGSSAGSEETGAAGRTGGQAQLGGGSGNTASEQPAGMGGAGSGAMAGNGGRGQENGSAGSGGNGRADASAESGDNMGVEAAAPDVTVHACDALGPDGTWQRIGPPAAFQSDAAVVNVAIDPLHAGTVYAGIGRSSSPQYGLWKSTDCGANWVHLNTGRNGSQLDSGSQWEIRVDPTNSDVYTVSAYGTGALYRSSNGGVDWDDITPKGNGIPSFVQQFSIDPGDHKHVIVTFHANCGGAYAPMCLGETTDGAATWRFVKGPSGGWGEAAGPSVLGGSQWIYAAPFDGVYVTKDSGATWTKAVGYAGCYMDPVNVSGSYYMGCLNMSIRTSTNGNDWIPLTNSPQASGIVATGKYLYAAFQNDNSGQPIHRAALSNLTSWTTVTTPKISQGPNAGGMPYDPHHRVLYVGAWGGGLWRVVTD
jgi:hypothetical protein